MSNAQTSTDTQVSAPPEIQTLDDLNRPHLKGCLKSFREVRAYLKADLHRYAGRTSPSVFWRHFLFTPGYKYTVWMRLCGYLRVRAITRYTLYPFIKYILLRCRYKYGIAIPENCVIGPGLFINRFGGIYVNSDAIIGSNVNFTHGIMLGQHNRGPLMGSPIVGDRVFLAAGSKVIGRVTLGNDSVVGANAVVTKDVPPMGVVGGIPAKVISMQGSVGYINRQAKL